MSDVLEFYDRHPISEAQVLAALARRRGLGGTDVTADDLFDFDQDHYGGLAAVDILASLAGVTAGTRVLDLCAGLGGPARFLASRRACQVVAVELNAGRAVGAARLTRLVGLQRRVRVVRGDATRLPLGSSRFEACLSQEAFLHVEDKAAVLAEAHRVLAPGGTLVISVPYLNGVRRMGAPWIRRRQAALRRHGGDFLRALGHMLLVVARRRGQDRH